MGVETNEFLVKPGETTECCEPRDCTGSVPLLQARDLPRNGPVDSIAQHIARQIPLARRTCWRCWLGWQASSPWGAGVWVLAAARHSLLACWGACIWVRASPVPRQSWLRFVVRVSGSGFWLSPRHSWLGCWGASVGVRAPPAPCQFSLGCAMWVCVLGFASVAPRYFWLGCLVVCVCVRAPLVPRQSWSGFVVCPSCFGFWLSPHQSWLGFVVRVFGLRI